MAKKFSMVLKTLTPRTNVVPTSCPPAPAADALYLTQLRQQREKSLPSSSRQRIAVEVDAGVETAHSVKIIQLV